MLERLRYAWKALRGERELPPTVYPRKVSLGGGLWTEVVSPEDEAKTREWLQRVAGWDGEHSA